MPNKKQHKKIPSFSSENAERRFWATHDSTEYINWSKAHQEEFPNLKPSTQTISIRLPETLLNDVKAAANRKDVPYQSYIKVLLDRALREETRS